MLETLEPRLLLSADPISAHLGDPASLVPQAGEGVDDAATALDELIAGAPAEDRDSHDPGLPPETTENGVAGSSSRTLVFIDAGVDDVNALLVQRLGDATQDVSVVMLEAHRDGIAQISEVLASYRDLDAVHVISHGTGGEVHLGSSVLDGDSLPRYADAVSGWSHSLADEADLLFYGCNLAADDDGRLLVDTLAALTGADVAASDDPTGSSAAGGNWTLEYHTGQVENVIALDPVARQAWSGVLDAAASGSELTVNTTVVGDQTFTGAMARAVASDAGGNFVVVWESNDQDGDGLGVYAQRFAGDGTPSGVEFQVNTETTSNQWNAAVAMNAGGEFVVVWQSDSQDGSNSGVYAQRYDASGVATGAEFRVNTTVSSNQLDPDVALHDDGSFVITWSSDGQDGDKFGVYAQRYDAAGTALGSEVQINSMTTRDQQWSSVAATPDGGFVVTWSSDRQDGDGYGVFARRFDDAGNALTGELRVNTETVKDQQRSAVAVAGDGSFVVVWESDTQDGNRFGIFGQRFLADGQRDGGEFQINDTSARDQRDASVSMDAGGNFVVAWTSDQQDGDGFGVYARQFDALGTPITTEVQVNTTTRGDQQSASVALADAGQHIITWSGEGAADDQGILAQRFAATSVPDIDLNGAGAGSGFSASFTEGDVPVAITDAAAAALVDSDDGVLKGLTVVITNPIDGAAELLDANVGGTAITKSFSGGVLSLSGLESVAVYQQVLRTVTYENISQAPATTERVVRASTRTHLWSFRP